MGFGDPPDDDPLILTAALDEASTAMLQGLRDRHFPARLNIVPAHLTLFHALPGAARDAIAATLAQACAAQPPIGFATTGLRFLGRGVAIAIEAAPLARLHRDLAARWQGWLTAQDRQPFRPHVTIQNKVPPAEARALLQRLEAKGLALRGTITGLRLWHYRGGPWAAAAAFAFSAPGGSAQSEPGAVPIKGPSSLTADNWIP